MINIHKCYFHSILSINKYALVKLEEILNDGYIKSAKDLDIDVTGELHQSDEICLSRYTPDVMYENGVNSATKEYLGQFITLILDDNIKTYKPNVVSVFNMNEYIIKSGEYTDLYDEYRTKNPIDINHIIGISLPIQELSENDFAYLAFTDQEVYSYLQYSCSEFLAMDVVRKKMKNEENRNIIIKQLIKEIKRLLEKYKLDIPVYEYIDGEQPKFKILR